uniref:Uncharacterized protein n=1 Tax=Alexandrium monilatum TaxID=311494 RepID=A0A7S4Q7B4_9DINO
MPWAPPREAPRACLAAALQAGVLRGLRRRHLGSAPSAASLRARPRAENVQINRELTEQRQARGLLDTCGARLPEFDVVNLSTALQRTAKSSDALSVLGDPRLVALLAAVLAATPQFTACVLANTVWSLARLRIENEPLLDAISASSIPRKF